MTPAESTYGRIAVIAAKKAAKGKDARLAWEETADTAASKCCPRAAFLGLIHAGLITGVPGDSNRLPGKNARYALVALDLLRHGSSHSSKPTALWGEVMKKVQGGNKKHNSQMHVVTALWNEKIFVGQST